MVKRPFMVRWVIGSITHGGPIEIFLVLGRAPRLVVTGRAPRLVVTGRGMCYPVKITAININTL